MPKDCPGCGIRVRLSAGELERLVAEYFGGEAPKLAAEALAEERLAACGSCPDLRFGSTCRHCGCLVEVRARLHDYACPAPVPRW
jgi:Family of unknown function (DUF6171)